MVIGMVKDKDISKILIESKADINIKGYNGYTALMHACLINCHELIKMLLKFRVFSQKPNTMYLRRYHQYRS